MNASTNMVAGALLAAMSLAGCTTIRQSFADSTAENVWTALVAVAETPQYEDWIVTENEVWVHQPQQRIEIYRRLRRILHRPDARPLHEQRTWRFEVRLEQTDPPEAVFISRGWGVPAHARIEAERYFADVWDMLSGLPSPEPVQLETQPATAPDTQPQLDLLPEPLPPPPPDE